MTSGKPHQRSGPDRDVSDRRLGRIVVAIVTFWTLLGFYIVHAQLPSNTMELPGQEALRLRIQQVLPQGWAFFTRSPREGQLVTWAPTDDGSWEQSLYGPHSEPRNVFGLNRRSRAQAVEVGLFSTMIPDDAWQDCEHGDIPRCLPDAKVVPVVNPSPQPLLCGPVGLSAQPPVPWAWAHSSDTRMPATVVRLEVRC
ncbi:MAG TPA: SdpA family antimicrobial peptide system protein [Natronosporangium sp.]|nr:SdpA family antimicrobial peptide system protein [Natronosporangium sp.]